jgi:hypothetical protein
MKVFGFDPADYRETYRKQEWVHIPGGIDPEFFAELRDFAKREFAGHLVTGRAIGGSKEQALYEFPQSVPFPDHLFDVVAEVCGLRRETMTLSERHIKAYDADAPEHPIAHKDRISSQVSVGLSIEIPRESSLVLYPFDQREVNLFNVSPALLKSLAPEEHPTVALQNAREVVIHDQPGDVVMFAGSSTWHLRRKGSGVVNLYLKFNDFDSDPLGEDPLTPKRRMASLAALDRDSLDGLRATPARQLDTIVRQHSRNGWHELMQANVWNENPVSLTADQFALLQALDGGRPVSDLLGELAGSSRNGNTVESDLRMLCARGVIDLL